ncbi:hypothetical protein AYL99_08913 [Fonsecaea erecta]|uniref:Uncharacterized protein n=1 Tax=Fonsecaea erecta TaxID=1367422 RepID=A0A178ZBD7_9EURO|nr:hypothetical protein AYL99_08913 [Fonsecaea erecta]OAP56801.1 hypothetical protein AYL99_08913 [Fonsecaea erecta]
MSGEENTCSRSSPCEHTLAVPGHGPPTANSPVLATTDEQSVLTVTGDKIQEQNVDGDLEHVAARSPLPTFSSSVRLEPRVFVPLSRRTGPHDRLVLPQRNTRLDQNVGSGTKQTLIPLNTCQDSPSPPRVELLRWESSASSSPGEAAVAGPPRRSASSHYTRSRRRRRGAARLRRSCSPTLHAPVPFVDNSYHARYDHHQATALRTAPVLSTTTSQPDHNYDIPEASTTTTTTTASKMSSYTMTYSPTSPHLTLSPMMTMPIALPPPTPAQDIPRVAFPPGRHVDEADMNIDEILSALPIGIPVHRSRSSSTASSRAPIISGGGDDHEEEAGGARLRTDPFTSIMYPGRGEVPQHLSEPKNKLLAALVEDSYPCGSDEDAKDDKASGAKKNEENDEDLDDAALVTVAQDALAAHCERVRLARDVVDNGPLRQRRVAWQIDAARGKWVDVAARGLSACANRFGAVGQRVTSCVIAPPVHLPQDQEKAVWTPTGWTVTVVPRRSGPESVQVEGPVPWTTQAQFGY